MKDSRKRKTDRPMLTRDWVLNLGVFIILQALFVVFDGSSWSPFQIREGVLLDRLLNSKLFAEWFTPYQTREFNLYTLIFAIALLPAACIGAVKDIASRKF